MPQEQNLDRKLGLFSVTNIVIANMIGAGIFTTTGLLMQDLQNVWLMLILWLVGGGIALTGAMCYGEVGAHIPKAGGEYSILSDLYNPMIGFLSGWISFIVGFSAPIAASAIGFSEYMIRVFPAIFEYKSLGPEVFKKVYAIGVVAVFSFLHSRGMHFGSILQNILTALKVLLILVLIAVGFTLGAGSWEHFSSTEPLELDFSKWKTIGLSVMWIMFAYSGWNASVYIGSEIRKPEKNLPRSLLIGTGSVMVLYFLLNALFVYAIEPDEMNGVISIGGLAVQEMFGTGIEKLFSFLIAFALFSSLSAFIILGPRVYYAMARDGYFFPFVKRIHPTHKVPHLSIYFQGLIACVIILTGTFDQVLTYMGFSLGIFPIFVVIGLFRLRKSKKSTTRLPGFPYTAILFLFFSVAMLFLAYFNRPAESSIALLTLLTGIPAYWLFKRYIKKNSNN